MTTCYSAICPHCYRELGRATVDQDAASPDLADQMMDCAITMHEWAEAGLEAQRVEVYHGPLVTRHAADCGTQRGRDQLEG